MSHRHDHEHKQRAPYSNDSAEQIERSIRARERAAVRYIHQHGDFGAARAIAYSRHIHTASIARSNADRRSTAR